MAEGSKKNRYKIFSKKKRKIVNVNRGCKINVGIVIK